MRSRVNSGVRLEALAHLVHRTILNKTDLVTGLIRSNYPGLEEHAWVRDNVYALHAVWGLARAYRNLSDAQDELAEAYELDQLCVKVMRSLMECMLRQAPKVERFKLTQSKTDCLHAKYHSQTLETVHGDLEWGHLQIDATSLYLLTLAQLTASGLQIIWNLDEVAFIQNLVYYIEEAYRIPDFGIWERGEKRNQGVTELNASSIGMAKAALVALDGLDLFGAQGSAPSVIHVPADAIRGCDAVLDSLLPRESVSKETDAALLSVISYPAFAVETSELIQRTRRGILDKLGGKYGCCRFLRDGYKTPREDARRLYYEPWELAGFEGIECEWPLFSCYLLLDALFHEDREAASELRQEIAELVLHTDDGLELVPELYAVPGDKVEAEIAVPGSQARVAGGHTPFVWAQSLYILGRLIDEKFIKPSELDPLNRRLSTEKHPQTIVQIAILAEDEDVKSALGSCGLRAYVETVAEVADQFAVQPASSLGRIWAQIGRSEKMGLSGRPANRDVGLLSTSKLYSIHGRYLVFCPQFLDTSRFYLVHDMALMVDMLKMEVAYLASAWCLLGRPLLLLRIDRALLFPTDDTTTTSKSSKIIINTLRRLRSGYFGETKVQLNRLSELVPTCCITSLDYLTTQDEYGWDAEFSTFLRGILKEEGTEEERQGPSFLPGSPSRRTAKKLDAASESRGAFSMSVVKNYSRHRSIILDPNDANLIRSRLMLRRRQSSSGGIQEEDDAASVLSSSYYASEVASPSAHSGEAAEERTPTRQQSSTVPTMDEGTTTPPPGTSMPIMVSRGSRMDMELMEEISCEELVEMLSLTESVEEQGDILYFIWLKRGGDWEVAVGERNVSVRALLEEVYGRACRERVWWLVRLGSGLLERPVDDIARAIGDLLVRQKQVTVGLPGAGETIITRPLPTRQLQALIRAAYGDDVNSAMLTQEILVYLGFFVRTEPGLFQEMLRLRVGLIIGVMAAELERGEAGASESEEEEATATLLNLRPFDVKTLLYNLLSGNEIEAIITKPPKVEDGTQPPHHSLRDYPRFYTKTMRQTSVIHLPDARGLGLSEEESSAEDDDDDTDGFWLRRRRIDGALNRVPAEFYSRIWDVVALAPGGISLAGHAVPHELTKEMTRGEIKFALEIETVLNRVEEPEYRQLLVEGVMVLSLMAESKAKIRLPEGQIAIDSLIRNANAIFLQDQAKESAEAGSCCAHAGVSRECGACGVCRHFYDSPPSGPFGSLTYITRAAVALSPSSSAASDLECSVS